MTLKTWIETFFHHLSPFMILVAFVLFEAEGIPYSMLFSGAVVASLGTLGIDAVSAYRKVGK